MATSLSMTGQGPGARLAQALIQNWGASPHSTPHPEPTHILLPHWWKVLLQARPTSGTSAWEGQWHRATPAGEWAPNALILITHLHGTLAVDLDPDDEGQRPAWWLGGDQLMRVAMDLDDLAGLLTKGVSGLEKLASTPRVQPAAVIEPDDLPFDPITRQWASYWERPRQVWGLLEPGQGLTLTPGWSRHPTRPLVALSQ